MLLWSLFPVCLLGWVALPGMSSYCPPGPGEFEILGLKLGTSSIEVALLKLGTADAAYLAGADSDRGAAMGDPIVLSYNRGFDIKESHPAKISLSFSPKTYVVSQITVDFAGSGVAKEEIRSIFGSDYRVIHQRLELDSGGVEGELAKCHDPEGEFTSWIYDGLGLQVEFESRQAPYSTGLRFSLDILQGKERYPPCPKGSGGDA